MIFPKESIRHDKRALQDALVAEFNGSRSWEEFCINASIKHGITITKLSKWFLAYKCIDFGEWKSRILMLFGIASIPLSIACLADFYKLDKTGWQMFCILASCGVVFIWLLAKFIKFDGLLNSIKGYEY